jgi:hypothetical protein
MQSLVHSVFAAVVPMVVTLITIGLTGIIVLLAADRDSPHA